MRSFVSPTQPSSLDHTGKISATVLHHDMQASAPPVHDAVEVAHDEGMAKFSQDIYLDWITHEMAKKHNSLGLRDNMSNEFDTKK